MRPMPELEVRTERVEDLVPYAGNAKLHPFEQVDQIAASISEFGMNDPIAVWHNDQGEMEIVEGHGRLLALKKLGIEECPVIYLDHLSEAQRRAYILAHNKLTMNSGFDFEILSEELDKLADEFDMGGFGFDNSFFDDEKQGDETQTRSKEIHFDDTLGVFVECSDEGDQERVYEELIESGFKCRLLTL